jgi:hypothetical protein
MKRRTLDFLFSAGGLVLASLLLILAVVMTSNANFSKDYVKDQLSQQKVTFKDAAALTAEEKELACVVKNAGLPLTTGKQAECYASYIGLHTAVSADGRTYATQGDFISGLRAELAAAQKVTPPDTAKVADLGTRITAATAARESLFKGETLKGLLLTSFGFSVFGVKAGQAATVSFIVAGLLALLSLAGFAHAFKTSKQQTFAAPESTNGKRTVAEKPLVGV